jgi:RNA 2',3'-cyclic 3'-phosphodiesterase
MTAAPDAEGAPQRRRVFFALWPDDATRASVVRSTRRAVQLCGGRPIAKDRLHVTVAFLGEVDAARLELARGAAPVRVGEFDLVLDMLGVWPQSRVLWLAGREVPAALNALEQDLWTALEERGFRREERIYRPHLTLARRAREVEEAVEPVQWRVKELALVESLPDGRNVHYEVLERWPL